MRKSTLFVSAMLTVFLMATMFGVVSAYQQVVKNSDLTATQAPAQVASKGMNADTVFPPVPTATEIAAPLVVTPEEATTVAMDFLGDPNVYSVEVVDYEGAPAYLVTFSSGDLVYVSSTGSVVANTKIEPVIVVASNSGGGGGGSNPSSSSSSTDDDHDDDDHDEDDHDEDDHDDDDHDDHEDHDDD